MLSIAQRGRRFLPWVLAVVAATALGAWSFTALAQAAAGDLEPLKLELPKPYFGSTPTPYVGKNLEPEAEAMKPRPPFLTPKGAENVAKGKPVTASSAPAMGKLEAITDGEKGYQEKYVVGLKPGLQHIQIDLGAPCELYAVVLWHYFMDDRVYYDVIVQVSDDPEFKTGVTTLFNNDDDNSAGLGAGQDKDYRERNIGKLIDAKGVKARYVRLYSAGNVVDDLNHYIEVEVFGKPAA